MNSVKLLASCLILWLGWAAAGVHAGSTPSASVQIAGAATQPANAPVLIDLLVTNTGAVPFSFWSSGPGEYPNASDCFTATVTRVGPGGGSSLLVELSNGQRTDGSGRTYEIVTGQTIRVPATLGPLDPGDYEVTVSGDATLTRAAQSGQGITWPAMRSTTPFHVDIRADDALASLRDKYILARVRGHDPFACYLAVNWPRPAVRAGLEADLTGDDIVAADRAADGLWGDRDPAAADLPLVARAILNHLQPPESGCDLGLLTRLTRTADARKPAELADAIDRLLESRTDGPIPRLAERWTRWMPKVDQTTLPPNKTFPVGEPIPQINLREVRIGTGLDLCKDTDPAERRLGYRWLADYANDPRAAAAIRTGLKDADPECRAAARTAATKIPVAATTQPG